MRERSSSIVTPGWAALVGVAALVATSCGRNHLARSDASVLSPDAAFADTCTDVVDAASTDARTVTPRDAAETETSRPEVAPFACASLVPLVTQGVLSNRHAKQVRFAPDGRALLLMLAGDDSNSDEAWVVSLPGGEQHRLAAGIKSAEWFGPATVLVTTVDADVLVFPSAATRGSEISTPIAHGVCAQATSPDGSRLYVLRDCTDSAGDLYVVDLADGFPKKFATGVSANGLAVSPGGRWAAYVVYTADASAMATKVHVVGKDGTSYAVPFPDSAYNPYFISDDLLLAELPRSTYGSPSVWGHRPGSDDVTLLTSGDHGFDGYVSNADRSAFLVAQFSPPPARTASLSLTDVITGRSVQLATDLVDHRMFEMRVRSFAMVPSTGRVIYVADTPSDGGRLYGVASVSQRGDDRLWLASNVGTVVVSPFGDRVAVLTTDRTSTPSKAMVTVRSPSTGAVQYADQAYTIAAVSFVPGDRGLLFAARQNDVATSHLRFLSFATGATTPLGEWINNRLVPYGEPLGIETDAYPIDPNGCFAPVDSDLAPSGTSLVLLPQ